MALVTKTLFLGLVCVTVCSDFKATRSDYCSW